MRFLGEAPDSEHAYPGADGSMAAQLMSAGFWEAIETAEDRVRAHFANRPEICDEVVEVLGCIGLKEQVVND